MISFDEFIKQDDAEKYKNMQMDIFEIQSLKDELNNRDEYISKLEVAFSKAIEELKSKLQQKENIIKEVREYIMTELISEWDIKNGGCVSGSDLPANAITPILEILDKENKQ